MRKKRSIYLFTNSFPYGKGEYFLESELKIISKYFNKIYVVPYFYRKQEVNRSKFPNNVIIEDPLFNPRKKIVFFIKLLQNWDPVDKESLKYFFNLILKRKNHIYKTFIRFIKVRVAMKSKFFSKIFNNDDIFYFYWGTNASDLIPFLNIKNKKIVRFHGSDLYEDIPSNKGFIPFRELLLRKVNLAVFISAQGQNYLKDKYRHLNFNSIVSRLGTTNLGSLPLSKGEKTEFVILSCSNIIPVKRVNLIIDALKLISFELKWIHIGVGPLMKEMKLKAENLPKNIRYEFLGFLENHKVKEYYLKNHIDIFLNVSESEGLPVSIMEAMSAGIPIIATDVGGTSELVDNEIGFLIPKEFEINDLGGIIKKFKRREVIISKSRVFNKWDRLVNAERNFTQFAKRISGI